MTTALTTTQKKQLNSSLEGVKTRLGNLKERFGGDATLRSIDLQQNPTFKVTPPKPSTGFRGLGEQIAVLTGTDDFSRGLDRDLQIARAGRDSALEQRLNALVNSPTESELEADIFEREGVNRLQEDLDDITSQIRSEQLSRRRKLEALQDNNPDGLFGGALNDEIDRIERDSLRKEADLSIIQLARQERYDSAKTIADRYVDAAFERSRNLIEATKINFEENKELFDSSEQRAFQVRLSDRERELDKEEKTAQALSDAKVAAITQATINGAPQNVLTAISSATTPEEVITAGGEFGSVDFLEREQLRASIDSSRASAANSRDAIAKRNATTQEGFSVAERVNLLKLAEAGDPIAVNQLGFDPNDVALGGQDLLDFDRKTSEVAENISRVTSLLANNTGVETSSGQVQSATLSGFLPFVGSGFSEISGTIPGALSARTRKDDFLNGVTFLVNNQTFDKLTQLKADGATFGSLSDSERVAIGRASTELASSAKVDQFGNVTGFRGSESKLRSNLQLVLQGYEAAQEQLNIEYGLTQSDRTEAANVWNNQ